MTLEQLAAIRERANNATPGPWVVQRPGREVWQTEPYAPGPALVLQDEHIYEPNAVFIAAARDDIPALLDHVDRLTKKLAAVRELHSRTFTEFDEWLDETVQRCLGCHMLHPCPTIQALEGDPDGSQ